MRGTDRSRCRREAIGIGSTAADLEESRCGDGSLANPIQIQLSPRPFIPERGQSRYPASPLASNSSRRTVIPRGASIPRRT